MYLELHKALTMSPELSHMEALVILKETQSSHMPARDWQCLSFVTHVMHLAWHLSVWAPVETLGKVSLELGVCLAPPLLMYN